MHAVSWRSARAARRIPAQLIAGRRFPPRLRSFHRSARLLSAGGAPNEPRDPATPSVSENNGEKPEQSRSDARPAAESSQHEAGAEIASEAADESPAVLAERLRRTRRLYQSALKRTSRAKQAEDFPPIHIPQSFLDNNVILHDGDGTRAGDLVDSAGDPAASGSSGPRRSGSLCLSTVGREQGEEDVAKLSLPLPERLFKLLEMTAAEENNNSKAEVRYEEILEYVDKLYHSRDPVPEGLNLAPFDETLHFSLYLELLAAISGSLATAKPELASSFPSAKSNLLLHAPHEGGIARLNQLVEDVAAHLQADVLKLDSQDIAELVGDYLGDGSEPSALSLRSLGYEAYRSKSDSTDIEEEEYEEYEAEEEPEDAQDDQAAGGRTSPAPRGQKKGGLSPFVIQGVQTMDVADLFKMLSGPSRGTSGRNAAMGSAEFSTQYGRDTSPESARWNDLKLGVYLDALLESTSTKRTSLRDRPQGVDTNPEQETTRPQPLLVGERGSFRLSVDDIGQNDPRKPPSPQRTIVLVNDYKELSATRQGVRVLDKLTELVHNRRKEGSEIMIVGTTSSAELVPELSRSAIRSLQAENEETFFRTIVVPLGTVSLKPSIEVQKILSENQDSEQATKGISAPGAFDFDSAERRRNETINVRHIHDMIRRLDHNTNGMERKIPTLRDSAMYAMVDWKSRVLAFHEVHRLVQTAIGLHQAASVDQKLDKTLIILADLMLRMSDDVKFSWVAHERQKLREPKDAAQHVGKAAPVKTPSDIKVEKVMKTANKHEKKLFQGVVNPSNIKTTFADVHAPQETTDALKTMTSLSLLRPDAFSYGVLATDKIPGLLLYGPPGTGKTLLAKAVAKESGATVLEVSGSEVYDMYVGEGEKNVRAIFSLARKLSPCVVFIDEADAMFGSRSGSRHRTSHREVLNQFLKEWDGMNDLSVFIMVATNRPFDMDDAVLRRLPRRLLVDLPTQKDRESILKIHLKDEQLDSDVDLHQMSKDTPFYSGSDLKNLCVAAALNCVREENEAAAAFREEMDGLIDEDDGVTIITTTTSDNNNAEAGDAKPTDAEANTNTSDETTPPAASPASKAPSTVKLASLYPTKRTLSKRHFDKAMQEISASISEDMATLTAIRKFDEQYGDKRGKRKKKSSWGFNVAGDVGPGEEAARVRPGVAASAAAPAAARSAWPSSSPSAVRK